ncbi:hypothetical protein AB4259_02770 [Vibrio amylolyticus]|uniref:hypothetical protein n=1 Tax=Vibrio amylolyticus TaxID=2847292 RepID=UPI003553016B
MASGKNNLRKCTKAYLEPTTDIARKFKQSDMIGNKVQTYIGLSPDLASANELLKRAGYSRMARNCALAQYSECVNTPSMDTEFFTFWVNQPASEQVIHRTDIDYPTADLIEVLNELSGKD